MDENPNLVPTTQEQRDQLCLRIGRVIVTWSSAENSLDMLVALIFQSAQDKPKEREIPKFFNRKVRYLRKAFNNVRPLKPFQTKALGILNYLSDVSEQRHAIIHGVLLGYDTQYNAYEFSKLDLPDDKTKHFEHRILITLNALDTAADNLVKADLDALEIGEHLFTILNAKDHTDQNR